MAHEDDFPKFDAVNRALWSGKRVLLVDDSEIVRADLTKTFTKAGLIVADTAVDGMDALRKLKSKASAFDLITLDIIMPVMDGIECYKRMRAAGYSLPCLIISYLAREASVPVAFGEAISPKIFLPKPLSVSDLELRLQGIFTDRRDDLPVTPQEPRVAQV